jgi:hypothetical protein
VGDDEEPTVFELNVEAAIVQGCINRLRDVLFRDEELQRRACRRFDAVRRGDWKAAGIRAKKRLIALGQVGRGYDTDQGEDEEVREDEEEEEEDDSGKSDNDGVDSGDDDR